MAVTLTKFSGADLAENVDAQVYTNASRTYSGNYLVFIMGSRGTSLLPPDPTITWPSGMTAVELQTKNYPNTGTVRYRHKLFHLYGSGTGTIAVDWTLVIASCQINVITLAGHDTSDPIVQSAVNNATSTTPTVTLAAFADAVKNVTLGWCQTNLTSAVFTKEDGTYTDIDGYQSAGMTDGEWKVGEDTSPSGTISSSRPWVMFGVEIRAAAAAPAQSVSAWEVHARFN